MIARNDIGGRELSKKKKQIKLPYKVIKMFNFYLIDKLEYYKNQIYPLKILRMLFRAMQFYIVKSLLINSARKN